MTNFRTSVINLDRPGDPSVFGDSVRVDAAELISRYPQGQARSALLPLLHLVQSEQGYITPDGIAFCSDILGLTKAQVAAVATFYTMYKRTPTGEYLVSVCTNTLCGMLGGDEIFAELTELLGVGNNQTTPDGSITIEHAECLAACDYAPVVTVNYEFFDNQSVESATSLVNDLREGRRPLPTRGAPLCSFKQIERQIAGLFDESTIALEANSTGRSTEAGVKLAGERGDTAPSYAVQKDAAPAATPEQQADAPAEAKSSRRRTRKATRATSDATAGSTGGGDAEAAAERSEQGQGPSEHDAPLQTAESDAANTTDPGTEKGD